MMKAKLKRAVLVLLLACDGLPMPEKSLISAAQLYVRPEQPAAGDVVEAIKDCEAEGYVNGHLDEFDQVRTYVLTEKGVHKARQLR